MLNGKNSHIGYGDFNLDFKYLILRQINSVQSD